MNLDSHEFLGDEEASKRARGLTAAVATKLNATTESQELEREESMETEAVAEAADDERDVSKDEENGENENGEEEMEIADGAAATSGEGQKEGEEGETTKPEKVEEEEYNPLIVRRSHRAIKPTKDVDLYLLGAQFGIDVESDADSSDLEFAPAVESDRESQNLSLIVQYFTLFFHVLELDFCDSY